ncbi:hypothetical protein HPB49_002058 [Dermacentor silvarum]|uniref:Uncharacterized protein n=1 Tax=Dermacentor silvarum TaxID=543639 RepID=A0ACB8C6Z5_DERSI|nr:hypothetical protein HPB49_002058 [Dermacentor silvarum]
MGPKTPCGTLRFFARLEGTSTRPTRVAGPEERRQTEERFAEHRLGSWTPAYSQLKRVHDGPPQDQPDSSTCSEHHATTRGLSAPEQFNGVIANLTGILSRFSSSNLELSSINAAIKVHISDNELEVEYSAAVDYDDQAIGTLAESRCQMAAFERPETEPPQHTVSPKPNPAVTNRATSHSGLRLPKLNLPTFRGDDHQCLGFWEQFEKTVHLNETLSHTTKFYHLRKYIAAEAAASIACLATTESCYADAVELPKERFGDRKKIEQYHLTALRNLPHVVSGNDVRGLRKL